MTIAQRKLLIAVLALFCSAGVAAADAPKAEPPKDAKADHKDEKKDDKKDGKDGKDAKDAKADAPAEPDLPSKPYPTNATPKAFQPKKKMRHPRPMRVRTRLKTKLPRNRPTNPATRQRPNRAQTKLLTSKQPRSPATSMLQTSRQMPMRQPDPSMIRNRPRRLKNIAIIAMPRQKHSRRQSLRPW